MTLIARQVWNGEQKCTVRPQIIAEGFKCNPKTDQPCSDKSSFPGEVE